MYRKPTSVWELSTIQHLRRRLGSKWDMDLLNFVSIQICNYTCFAYHAGNCTSQHRAQGKHKTAL